MLTVRELSVDIMGSPVLRGVSFTVKAGELVCVVGRNGAGKTTCLRSIMGFRKPVAGSIEFAGRNLAGMRPFEIARAGIGFAPEESEIFGELSVAENIALPTWTCAGRRSVQERLAAAYHVFPALERYRSRGGHALSGGERKMVSIARALALDPKLLLLDEPSEGLSPVIVPSILDALGKIGASGTAVFLAESNIYHVPDLADRLYVIERGEIIFAGSADEARSDAAVRRVIEGTAALPA